MTFTLGDSFAGCGGLTQGAAEVDGIQPAWAANHESINMASHGANFPRVDHYCEDITTLDYGKFPRCDLAHFSPACFPAGTLILAQRGLIPIENVRLGDLVFTHERRWRPVTATSSRDAATVTVYANGIATGIETTAEHPFYTRLRLRPWNNSIHRREWRYAEPEWTEAGHLARSATSVHMIASPAEYGDPLAVPPVPGRGMTLDADFWWLIGRWLGDGMLAIRQVPPRSRNAPKQQHTPRTQPAGSICVMCPNPPRPRKDTAKTGMVTPYCSDKCMRANQPKKPSGSRNEIIICCGHHEADDLGGRLAKMAPALEARAKAGELRWQRRTGRTTTVFTASHRDLIPWIAEHFGRHAAGKTLPAWALMMSAAWRAALLDGYLSADGNIGHATVVSTVSKHLAVGMRLLATSLGHTANIHGPYTRKPGRMIEGRVVNERPTWVVSWITDGPVPAYSVVIDGCRWQPIRHVVPTGRIARVFNISVAGDESYLADGVMVHNCPSFTDARGERQHFDSDTQGVLFEDELGAQVRDEVRLGRALMHEVPRYLEAMCLRGQPVLAGTVENVVQARKWGSWDAWLRRIQSPDGRTRYRTRVIAVNSMHLAPLRTIKPPQSRDRLLVMFWLESIGRDPDVGKWLLRPRAWCPGCEEWVNAMQSFKRPGNDMGRYGIRNGQYVYRCPHRSCRNRIVEPPALGAEQAIDWSNLGTPIGDRPRPLEQATLRRIRDGITRHWEPLLVPSGGTWRDKAQPLADPMPARTTRETDGIALPPFSTILRRNSSARLVSDPLATITTSGAHHGLVTPTPMLIPYYTKGRAQPVTDPMGALSTRDRYGLATTGDNRAIDIGQVRYRMLATRESAAGMGFHPGYIILGNVTERTRQIGQAITPVLGELSYSAIVEMLTGEEKQPAPWPDQLGMKAAS